MARRDDLMGIAGAYLHSLFAIAGPWLFTVVALAFTTYLYGGSNNIELLNFRGVIVYNFSFSLALSAPVYFIMTRYLADQIHVMNVQVTDEKSLSAVR
jgi:polysaccharide biosynthesis protein PelG